MILMKVSFSQVIMLVIVDHLLTHLLNYFCSTIWLIWLNGRVFINELSGCGSNPVAVFQTSVIAPVLSKEFLDTQVTTECRFTLKCVCDMRRTDSHINGT